VTLSIITEDRFGVLTHITSFFTARGYSIDQLTAARCRASAQTQIKVVLDCPPSAGEYLVKQLHKLTDVIEAEFQH
jgi:acetolactate synthase-1/3 small subunit